MIPIKFKYWFLSPNPYNQTLFVAVGLFVWFSGCFCMIRNMGSLFFLTRTSPGWQQHRHHLQSCLKRMLPRLGWNVSKWVAWKWDVKFVAVCVFWLVYLVVRFAAGVWWGWVSECFISDSHGNPLRIYSQGALSSKCLTLTTWVVATHIFF